MDRVEEAALILSPYHDAARDIFCEFEISPGKHLPSLKRVKLVVEPDVHDTPRHFGACSEDGFRHVFAPETVTLDEEQVIAIISHEFGHSCDLIYQACWYVPAEREKPATWIGERPDDKSWKRWRRLWRQRSRDQVELAADAIAYAVTGRKLGYCGELCLQCFSGGRPRPKGLR